MSLILSRSSLRLFPPKAPCFPRSEPRVHAGCRRKLKLGHRHNELRRPRIHSLQYRMASTVSDLHVPTLDANNAPHQGQDDLDPDFKSAIFHKIIQEGQPELILNMFTDPRYADLLGSLPQDTFVNAFRLLSPAYFVIPYRDIYRPLHPTASNAKNQRSLPSIFDKFASDLLTIIRIRESAGHHMSLAEYKHLLDCARSMGDRPLADSAWHAMKEDPNVEPDRQCYNYYMEALIWDNSYVDQERYHLRVTVRSYWKRRDRFVRHHGYRGYGTGFRSVRREVTNLFHEMTDMDISGDEETFVDLLISCARVGHKRGMKHTLWVIWGVDVDALCSGDQEPPAAMPLPRSSLVYPTDRLLFAVAHSFGTNSDIVAALRCVKFISGSYDVPITERVWLELFERAFELSRPRPGTPFQLQAGVFETPEKKLQNRDFVRNDLRKGEVAWHVLFQLCSAMLSSPYNTRPTVNMYRMVCKTAWDNRTLHEFLVHMRASYNLLRETRRKRKEARLVVEDYLARLVSPSGDIDILLLHSRDFADAVNTYSILRLQTTQNTILIERFARLLVINRWWGEELDTRWERWHFPRLFEEWQDFLPEIFDIWTTGGLLKFTGRTGWGLQYLNCHKMIPRRRTVDSEPSFEEETSELDDDFFWAKYLESSPLAGVDNRILNRVFWDSHPSGKYVVTEDEVRHRMYVPRKGATPSETQRRQLGMPVLFLRWPRKTREKKFEHYIRRTRGENGRYEPAN